MNTAGAQNLPVDLAGGWSRSALLAGNFQCRRGKDSHSNGAIREAIDTLAGLVP
jgi:hypothetical protein